MMATFEQALDWIFGIPHLAGAVALVFGGVGAAVAANFISARLARAIKISEFRQKWIDELRSDIAGFVGASHRWVRAYEDYNEIEDLSLKPQFEQDKIRPIQNEAYVILFRIRMRINPLLTSPTKERDDKFLQSLNDLLNPGAVDPESFESSWFKLADAAVEKGRIVLKEEWDVAKQSNKWF
jgi:hypothetical protein